METLESLRKRIETTDELFSIVRTMKTLAAVNIRHFERAVESLDDYLLTIEMGLRIVLRDLPGHGMEASPGKRLGAVVFGSEQGLSGQFNDQIADFSRAGVDSFGVSPALRSLLAIGDRVVPRIEEYQPVTEYLPFPNSLPGIPGVLQDVLAIIERWRFSEGIERIVLYHHRLLSGASYRPVQVLLLPVDEEWMRSLEARGWTSRTLPLAPGDKEGLFSSLIRQYLFVTLYRAFVHSMASENASRLASMQTAEKNIRDRSDELTAGYHHQRQNSVTAEMLDIIAGYEALEGRRDNF